MAHKLARDLCRLFVLLAGFGITGALAASNDVIELHYYHRPPFYDLGPEDKITGLLVGPTDAAFKAAGVKFTWVSTPANRILAVLRSAKTMACSPGWFWTDERQQELRYTNAIYVDHGAAAILGPRVKIPADGKLATLLEQPLRHVFKSGLVSGGGIGPALAIIPEEQRRYVTLEVDGIIKMISADHGDVFIGPVEELDPYARNPSFAEAGLKLFQINEPYTRERRFIICSKLVPQSTIDALNAHIPPIK